MKFLANENFPFPSIKFLRENGYEIISISEESSGIADSEVLQKASAENLIILTFDSDYGELIFKYKKIIRRLSFISERKVKRRMKQEKYFWKKSRLRKLYSKIISPLLK